MTQTFNCCPRYTRIIVLRLSKNIFALSLFWIAAKNEELHRLQQSCCPSTTVSLQMPSGRHKTSSTRPEWKQTTWLSNFPLLGHPSSKNLWNLPKLNLLFWGQLITRWPSDVKCTNKADVLFYTPVTGDRLSFTILTCFRERLMRNEAK